MVLPLFLSTQDILLHIVKRGEKALVAWGLRLINWIRQWLKVIRKVILVFLAERACMTQRIIYNSFWFILSSKCSYCVAQRFSYLQLLNGLVHCLKLWIETFGRIFTVSLKCLTNLSVWKKLGKNLRRVWINFSDWFIHTLTCGWHYSLHVGVFDTNPLL